MQQARTRMVRRMMRQNRLPIGDPDRLSYNDLGRLIGRHRMQAKRWIEQFEAEASAVRP